jgi:hypothetical protein
MRLYCYLWPVWLDHIFPHYLINSIFSTTKKSLTIKRVLIFSTNLSETLFILRRIQRDMIKIVDRSSCEVPVILVRFLWSLNFSLQNFAKFGDVKFHENPSRGSRVVPSGQTNTTKLILVVRNFTNSSKNHITPNNYSNQHEMEEICFTILCAL